MFPRFGVGRAPHDQTYAAARDAISGLRPEEGAPPIQVAFVIADPRYEPSEIWRAFAGEFPGVPLLGISTAGQLAQTIHEDSVAFLGLSAPKSFLAVRIAVGAPISPSDEQHDLTNKIKPALESIGLVPPQARSLGHGDTVLEATAHEFLLVGMPGRVLVPTTSCPKVSLDHEIFQATTRLIGRFFPLFGAPAFGHSNAAPWLLYNELVIRDSPLFVRIISGYSLGFSSQSGFRCQNPSLDHALRPSAFMDGNGAGHLVTSFLSITPSETRSIDPAELATTVEHAQSSEFVVKTIGWLDDSDHPHPLHTMAETLNNGSQTNQESGKQLASICRLSQERTYRILSAGSDDLLTAAARAHQAASEEATASGGEVSLMIALVCSARARLPHDYMEREIKTLTSLQPPSGVLFGGFVPSEIAPSFFDTTGFHNWTISLLAVSSDLLPGFGQSIQHDIDRRKRAIFRSCEALISPYEERLIRSSKDVDYDRILDHMFKAAAEQSGTISGLALSLKTTYPSDHSLDKLVLRASFGIDRDLFIASCTLHQCESHNADSSKALEEGHRNANSPRECVCDPLPCDSSVLSPATHSLTGQCYLSLNQKAILTLWYRASESFSHTEIRIYLKVLGQVIHNSLPFHEVLVQKMQFMMDISHQLNSPMGTISWEACNILEEAHDPRSKLGDLRKRAERIRCQSRYMSRLIADLNHVINAELRPWSGPQRPLLRKRKCPQVSLKKLIFDVINDLRHLQEDSGVSVDNGVASTWIVDEGEDIIINILQNLLENACKYSVAGTQVFILSKKLDDGVEIRLKNISPFPVSSSEADRSFLRFHRSEAAQKVFPGTGIGLPLAKERALFLGGSIRMLGSSLPTANGLGYPIDVFLTLPLSEQKGSKI